MSHYETLGISKESSQNEIKKAYRSLAKKHHPDKGGDEEVFKKINDAYNILSDPSKKQQYDNPMPIHQGFRINLNGNNIQNVQRHIIIQTNGDHQIHKTIEKHGNHTITTTIVTNRKTGQRQTTKQIQLSNS